ncbi:mCG1049176 [Mus musculus]|nr:mCG1049176 [Mus musculus]
MQKMRQSYVVVINALTPAVQRQRLRQVSLSLRPAWATQRKLSQTPSPNNNNKNPITK